MGRPKITLLADAVEYVRRAVSSRRTVKCPCCSKRCHADRRRFNRDMAKVLVLMCKYREKYPADEWIHVTRLLNKLGVKTGRDWPRLKYWGLIEECPNSVRGRRGFWRVTRSGVAFAKGQTQVQQVKYTFNDGVVEIDTAESRVMIDIHTALSGFSFTEDDLWAL